MSFANQTVFTHMVDDFGDQLLSGMQLYFFNSSLVQFLVGISATIFFVDLAFSIKEGKPKFKAYMYVIAWLACLPISGKPLGFTFVNAIGTSISYALEKSVNFAMNQSTTTGGSGMPPYYAANAFIRAANARITDPNVKTEIASIMQNCVPEPGAQVTNNDGLPLSGMDLLIPSQTPQNTNVGAYQFNFGSNAQNVLKNTPSHITDLSTGSALNCYDLLVKAQTDIRTDMMNQNLTAMPQAIAMGSAPGATNEVDFSQPTSVMAQNVQAVSLNMGSAIASSYAAMGMVNKDVPLPEGVDESMYEVSRSVGGVTSFSLALHSALDSISKSSHVFKNWDIGAKLSELNEKMYTLPSMISTAQLWLKLLSPLAFLTMMFGTARIVITWCGMWFATLIFPVIANIFGSYLSGLIAARYQFDATAGLTPTNANFLMRGESLDAIGDVMRDFASHVDTTLNYQLAAFGLISTLIIGGAWFSHKLANTGLVSALGMATRMVASQGIYQGLKALGGGANLKTISSASRGGTAAPGGGDSSAASRTSFALPGGGSMPRLPGGPNIAPRGPSGSPSSGGSSSAGVEPFEDFNDGPVWARTVKPKQLNSGTSASVGSMPLRRSLPASRE